MRYRKLDENGDYSFGRQSMDFYVDEPDAVRQAVQTRLGLWAGDWFLDTSEGTDWRAKVLGKYTASTYDPEVRARVLGTQGVTAINQYYSVMDHPTRALNVSAVVDTVYSGIAPQSFVLNTTIAPPIVPPPVIDHLHAPLGDQFILGTTELGN